MNFDDSSPSPSASPPPPSLDPALEARLVAWILGESSSLDAAELARLCSERPECEAFRRQIAEAHGLVATAHRPVADEFRLSPERRARLLATLATATSPSADTITSAAGSGSVAFTPAETAASPRRNLWREWALPAAACVALLGLLAAIVLPTAQRTFGLASQKARRPDPMDLAYQTGAAAQAFESTSTLGSRAEFAPEPATPSASASPADGAKVVFRLDSSVATPSPDQPMEVCPVDTPRRQNIADESRRRNTIGGSQPTSSSATGFALDAISEKPSYATAPKENERHDFRDQSDFNAPIRRGGAFADTAAMADKKQMAAKPADDVTVSFNSELAAAQPESPPASPAPSSAFGGENKTSDDADRRVALSRAKQRAVMVEEVSKAWQRPGVYNEGAARQESDAGSASSSTILKGANTYTGSTRISSGELRVAGGAVGKDALDAPRPAPRPSSDLSLRRETSSSDEPVSTFSLHVSDASFRLARAALARGEFPDPASVRPEEFYNAFDYGDPAPRAGEPVAARIEQAAHPFLQQRNLLRVALRVPAAGRSAGQPLRLTLLLDTSGSMEREDRAATIRAALEQLATLLGPADRVTLIGFARAPRLLADRLPGDQASGLVKLVADTPPEGGTNLDEALKLAADLALRQFDGAAQNRIVLLTDGAANLGDADPAALSARVVQLRQKGVAFDACGVGASGLDDGVLEALTRQGDGRYLLLNSADEAGPAFARQLAGAFRPAAQNVKVQVRFNPARVPRYRLIGFEQHRLREQDFRDDKVDAAELAAAEAAVALYQVEVDPQGSGELGEVFVRFRETSTGRMVERSWPLPYDAAAPSFDRASPSIQLAGLSALLAEKLRGGDFSAQIRLAEFDPVAAALRARYAAQPRVGEFLDMFSQARRLAPE